MNYNYQNAEINTDLPFPICKPNTSVTGKLPYIDAIYIPTQEHRPELFTALTTLKKHSKHIYLLFSGTKSKWAGSLCSKRISNLTELNSCFDLEQYKNHITSQNPSTCINPDYDIPAKRTFALEHAKSNKFSRIGFLDDDIKLNSEDLLNVRIALSTSADMVSFHVLSFPDVSTVDHIERIIYKQVSRVSIGGNCLFVRTENCRGYFPYIYNDDWFFIFKNMSHNRIISLGTAQQRPYEPWVSSIRIKFEQFGDIIIEGIKANIAAGNHPFLTSTSFWKDQINKYISRLRNILNQSPDCILRDRLNIAINESLGLIPMQLHNFVSNYNSSKNWRES